MITATKVASAALGCPRHVYRQGGICQAFELRPTVMPSMALRQRCVRQQTRGRIRKLVRNGHPLRNQPVGRLLLVPGRAVERTSAETASMSGSQSEAMMSSA